MNHTPGPWHVSPDMRGVGNLPVAGVEDANDQAVANCGRGGDSAANARLIAAAPELLAALTAVEARLTSVARAFYVDGKQKALQSAFQGWKDDITPARSALAKASVLPRNF